MGDLIQREDAIEAMRECWRRVYQFAKPFEANRIKDCIQAVKNLRAVDAAPVVHGEWKWSHGGQCSECGFHNSNFDYNFCPNCGAKMDKEG